MADSFVQVAPDSSGKQIDMETVTTAAGPILYQQRARIVGDSAEAIFQILATNQKILAVMRALLALQNARNTTPVFEDDFLNVD